MSTIFAVTTNRPQELVSEHLYAEEAEKEMLRLNELEGPGKYQVTMFNRTNTDNLKTNTTVNALTYQVTTTNDGKKQIVAEYTGTDSKTQATEYAKHLNDKHQTTEYTAELTISSAEPSNDITEADKRNTKQQLELLDLQNANLRLYEDNYKLATAYKQLEEAHKKLQEETDDIIAAYNNVVNQQKQEAN